VSAYGGDESIRMILEGLPFSFVGQSLFSYVGHGCSRASLCSSSFFFAYIAAMCIVPARP